MPTTIATISANNAMLRRPKISMITPCAAVIVPNSTRNTLPSPGRLRNRSASVELASSPSIRIPAPGLLDHFVDGVKQARVS